MKYKKLHRWSVSPARAVDIQRHLSKKIRLGGCPKIIKKIAGVDVAFSKSDKKVSACCIVLTFPDLEILEQKTAVLKVNFPYIPGLLTFREGPAILKCLKKIKNIPDVIFFDGQGTAHPRRMGLGTHLGILLDVSTVGCAKSHLWGKFQMPHLTKGSFSFVKDTAGKKVGVCLRTRSNVKPVFVSCGHKIGIKKAKELVLASCRGFRIPQPIRLAHILANRHIKELNYHQ